MTAAASRRVELVPTDRRGKKWEARFGDGEATVLFGDSKYEDYTVHRDEARRLAYLRRHGGTKASDYAATDPRRKKREDWSASGMHSAGFWSRWLLWNKRTIDASVADRRRRFGLRITRWPRYEACLQAALPRERRGDLRLCARGYCSAKQTFARYPSAYANLHAAAVCNGERDDATGARRASARYARRRGSAESGLRRWLEEKWVNVCERDARGDFAPCGDARAAGSAAEYPYCRPSVRASHRTPVTAHELSGEQIRGMCARKRGAERARASGGTDRRPTRVRLGGEK
jgi:hypothetical protein